MRERTEDLPALIGHILQTLRIPGAPKRTVAEDALHRLASYAWPGNVRELRNVIERIILMGTGTGPITGTDVERVLPTLPPAAHPEDPANVSLDEIERRHILRVLTAAGGNKTQAAKTLDIDYKTLLAKLKKFEVDSQSD